MRKRSYKLYPYILISALLFFIGNRLFFFSPGIIEDVSSYVLYPVVIVQQKVVTPVKAFFERKRTVQELEQQIQAMRQEKETLLGETIALRAALHYADDIKEVAEFKKSYENCEGMVVQIIAKNISDQSHFILIDAGLNKGVEKDMVAVYKNGLVGRVDEVYPLYSKVVLITDTACKVAASCAQTHADGIHEGCNRENKCVLNRVSHLAKVQEGDMVLSSGEGLIFPKGFALGKVKSYAPDGLVYRIEIEPLFDIRTLNYCFLMRRM